jgi:hypothetical protein
MTNSNQSGLYKDLLQLDGKSKYINKIKEELAELLVEVCHYELGKSGVINLADEIADVEIQLEKLFILDPRIEVIKNERKILKLERLNDIVYSRPEVEDVN